MAVTLDQGARRVEIAEATWRVLERAGYAGATVRAIAREAGYTTGVLSHHFRDKHELVLFAYQVLVDRQAGRVGAAARRGLAAGLAELLPLDARRRHECMTWVVLTTASLGDEQLRAECGALCEAAREQMRPALRPHLGHAPDPAAAADDLLVAADGITFNALCQPRQFPARRQRAMLERAIAGVAAAR